MSDCYAWFEDIIPSIFNTKKLFKDATELSLKNQTTLQNLLNQGKINYTGILGKKLIDVDIDDESLYAEFEKSLPKTLATRNNKGINHYFFINDIELSNNINYQNVEIKVNGHVILPPSVVENIGREWAYEVQPLSAEKYNLLYEIKKIVFKSILNSNYPKIGKRNNVILALSAWLCYSGFKEEDIKETILECSKNHGDFEDRHTTIKNTIQKFKEDKKVSFKEVENLVDSKVLDLYKSVLKEPEAFDLNWMNENFCFIESCNEVWDIKHCVIQKNHNNLRKLRLSSLDKWKGKKRTSIFDEWAMSKDKFTCENVDFFPGKGLVHFNNLNLWKETGCSPTDYSNFKIDEKWSDEKMVESFEKSYIYPIQLLLKGFFLRENQETNKKEFDEESYNYLLKWLAYPLQNPGKKMDTAVVMYSEMQGVGKGSFCQLMNDIYGESYIRILGSELTNDFNDYLLRKQLVFIDEIRTNDRTHVIDYLKTLITEPTINVNRKFQPILKLNNTINFILATNYDYALSITNEDRRFFIVEINKKPSESFFKIFHEWRLGNGASSFLYYLLNNVDLTDFNPHIKAPTNIAKENIIELNKPDLEVMLSESKEILPKILTSEYVIRKITVKYDYRYHITFASMGRALKKAGYIRKTIPDKENKTSVSVWLETSQSGLTNTQIISKLKEWNVTPTGKSITIDY